MPDHTTAAHPSAPPAHAELPAAPFTAMQFHFGMLLGVDDLETLAANPRGKLQLHNAWLHRAGVVWGFGVGIKDGGELEVRPGLATDGLGRELSLGRASCLELGQWYGKYHDRFSPPLEPDPASGAVTFTAHVVARYRACLARPVPAIADPCAEGARDIAWSRAQETVELLLVPGPAPAHEAPYPRLRLLFGLREADLASAEDLDIVARRDAIAAALPSGRPAALLALFRHLAAKDTVDLAPADDPEGEVTLFPAREPADVPLAELAGIRLLPQPDGAWRLDVTAPPELREEVRPSHVAHRTVQELLCGALHGAGVSAVSAPRVRSFSLSGRVATVETTAPLIAESVTDDAFEAATFTSGTGWAALGTSARVLAPDRVEVTFDNDVGDWLRFIARGTGPTPLLGLVDGAPVPLAGAEGGPPGSAHDGHDYVLMHKRS